MSNELLIQAISKKAEKYKQEGKERYYKILNNAVVQALEHGNYRYLEAIQNLKWIPVTIEEFVTSPEYLGDQGLTIWPSILDELKIMKPDVWAGEEAPYEYILTGGCHAKGTKILTYSGEWVNVEDIKVGQTLMGDDGTKRNVLDTVSGRQTMYKIIPSKGKSFIVNEDHILSLKRTRRDGKKPDVKAGSVVNLTVKDYLQQSAKFKHLHKLYRPKAVEFDSNHKLDIDPYFLGLMLGDGGLSQPGVATFHSKDSELLDYVRYLYPNKRESFRTGCTNIHLLKEVSDQFDKYGLSEVNSHTKFIPQEYKASSVNDRLKVLAGIIDTDGTLCKNKSTFTITTASEKLAEDIRDLAQSCGLAAYISDSKVRYLDEYKIYKRISISGDTNIIPTLLERKKATKRKQKKDHLVTGFSVEKLEEDDYYGFSLDGNQLFVMEDYIVTHNTGIAKTFLTNIMLCYDIYLLTCFENPQAYYGLSKFKPIVIGSSAARPAHAKRNVVKPVINLFVNMPYTHKHVKYNQEKIKTELEIYDQNISFTWLSADREAYMGNDLIGASIEEVNAMKYIHKSTRSSTSNEQVAYDQAQELMSEIIERYESRFKGLKGPKIGGIYAVSSANHYKDYISNRKKIIDTLPEEDKRFIYIYEKRRWDMVPKDRYPSNKWFNWLLTTREYKGKILTDEEVANKDYPYGGEIMRVPHEHRKRFLEDPDTAQRDIIGRPASTVEVFIRNPEKIDEAILAYRQENKPLFTRSSRHMRAMQNFDLSLDGMPEIIPENLPGDKMSPRIIHVDIATGSATGKSDKCGISMVKFRGNQAKEIAPGHVESEAVYEVEMAISITPSGGHEIMIEEIRDFALKLATVYGLNIILFSFDQHQSKESQQKIANAGFRVNQFSCRKTPESYGYFKEVLYSNRVTLPDNEVMKEEMQYLQQDATTGKVGHAPGMHDDICDAIVSAMYQFTLMPKFRNVGLTDEHGHMIQTRTSSVERRSPSRKSIVKRRRSI